MQRKFVLLICAGGILTAVCWLRWAAERDPRIAFLPTRSPAQWVVYPQPTVPYLQAVAKLPASFRRSFVLQQAPKEAVLSVRAFRQCSIAINGTNLPGDFTERNWKDPLQFRVTPYLRPGTNWLTVVVSNHLGPPALWLTLQAGNSQLITDDSWEASYAGSVWRPVQLATAIPPLGAGNPLAGAERTRPALLAEWPWLLSSFVLSLPLLGLAFWWFTRQSRPPPVSRWKWTADPAAATLAGLVLLWLLLFTHNLSLVPRNVGFDSDGHLQYIQYLQEHCALPFADQGWEMHQPPLYYLLGAGALSLFSVSASTFDGLALLRLLSLLIGLGHLVIVFACLRLVFPSAPGKQAAGLFLAGLLPMQLFLYHNITNETLAAALMSATIYFCLRWVSGQAFSIRLCAAIGLCLGLALLTKVTALVLVPFVAAAFLYRMFAPIRSPESRAPNAEATSAGGEEQTPASLQPPSSTLGPYPARQCAVGAALALAICVAVCGWHYWRVGRHFGQAFFVPTRWAYGVTWWQDPGYHTAAFFARFGHCFTAPFFSSIGSFADGIYSTLWGDGLCGGASAVLYRPPWNYELMAVGFVLSLIPSILLLAGLGIVLLKLWNRPEPVWLGLLAFGFALALAVIHLDLEVPVYAEAKAVFALAGLVPLCALFAAGWGWGAAHSTRLRIVLAALLASWGATSYLSFWVRPNSPATRTSVGRAFLREGNLGAAAAHLRAVWQSDPHQTGAASFLVTTLLKQGQAAEAADVASGAVQANPQEALCQLALASVLDKQGALTNAFEHTQQAVRLAPDQPDARLELATRLFSLRRHAETIAACREALRLTPANPQLHFLLGCSLVNEARQAVLSPADSGNEPLPLSFDGPFSARDVLAAEAINHFHYALELAPDAPEAMNNLAWLLATYPRAELRNAAEAVRLALQAVSLNSRPDAGLVLTLAAAYAEAGQFPLAAETAQKAGHIAEAGGNHPLQERSHRFHDLFLDNQPFRQPLSPAR